MAASLCIPPPPHSLSHIYTQTHKINLKIKKKQKGKKGVSQKLTMRGDAKEEGEEVAMNFHHQEAKAAHTTLLLKTLPQCILRLSKCS